MFTATKDLVLATAVTGSWPRPSWFDDRLDGRSVSEAMRDSRYREHYQDALSSIVIDQERAGLDILVHGDYHHDDSFAGSHWALYPPERLTGYEGIRPETWADLDDPRGTIMHEIEETWQWPRVVGKVGRDPSRPLDFTRIWQMTQSRTTKPVMFGTISGQAVATIAGNIAPESPYAGDARAYAMDVSTAINQELRELAAAGCQVIQVEEPLVHTMSYLHPDDTEQIDFLVDAFNHEVAGLEGVEVWVHTCWGNPHNQRTFPDASYANAIETFLERMNFDVWTVEAKTDDGEILGHLREYRNLLVANDKKIALGAVDQRRIQVETPEEVAAFARRALEIIPPEHLALTTDCGYGRPGAGRTVALYKSAALAQGANIIRRELGVPETPVPLAG